MTDDELIQGFNHAKEEVNYFQTMLETESEPLCEMETNLEEYLDLATKAKALGHDLSYYSLRITELNTNLIKQYDLLDTIKGQIESWEEQADYYKRGLEDLGYEYVEFTEPNKMFPFLKDYQAGWRKKEDHEVEIG